MTIYVANFGYMLFKIVKKAINLIPLILIVFLPTVHDLIIIKGYLAKFFLCPPLKTLFNARASYVSSTSLLRVSSVCTTAPCLCPLFIDFLASVSLAFVGVDGAQKTLLQPHDTKHLTGSNMKALFCFEGHSKSCNLRTLK